MDKIYNIQCGTPLILDHEYAHCANTVEFQGFGKEQEISSVYLLLGKPVQLKVPLTEDFKVLVTAPITRKAGKVKAQLMECKLASMSEEYEYVRYSDIFEVVITPSLAEESEIEVTDPRLELIYTEMLEAFQSMPTRIDEKVQEWLDEHPEATTTVQDGSITESKLSAPLKALVDFVDNIKINDNSFLSLYDSGYTALQGMCVIDDKYMVVCRYCGTGAVNRSLRVYDIVNKQYLSESIFTDAQVGHCNTMSYDNGYIYVATLIAGSGVVRLRFDEETKNITYDSVVYSGSISVKSAAVKNGQAYLLGARQDGLFTVYKTEDFENIETAFQTDFNGNAEYLASQGISYDGNYLYIALSGTRLPFTTATLYKQTEKIYILKTNGEICKCLTYPRGSYGEIEDVETITLNNQTYIAIGVNQDANNVSYVHLAALYKSTTPVTQFETVTFGKGLFNTTYPLIVYVDPDTGTPFGDGTPDNPFPHPLAAIGYIKRANVATDLYIKGTYAALQFRAMSMPLTVRLAVNSSIGELYFKRCSSIIIDSYDTNGSGQVQSLKVDESNVHMREGIRLVGGGTGSALTLNRSMFAGTLVGVSNYETVMTGISSLATVWIQSSDSISVGIMLTGAKSRNAFIVNGKLNPS